MVRFILHVDVDEFIAAVEILRRPELRGKPVVVGGDGDPTKRGVVSTASYAARRFGIGSGMPLRVASRRCPEAIFLAVDREAYEAASERVMKTLGSLPGVLEVAGWDEAFLEIDSDDPETAAAEIQRAVRSRSRLACSVGIGDNKLRAKIASGLAKPAGVFRLTEANWLDVMGARPVDSLWGIGRKRTRQLSGVGIRTVGDLAGADEQTLAATFGPTTGPWFKQVAQGDHSGRVSAEPHVAKSRSREVTFQQDATNHDEIRDEVVRLARQVADDLDADARLAKSVTVKIRFAPFETHSRSVGLEIPTRRPEALAEGALRALVRFELDRPVRLIGVKADLVIARTNNDN